MQGGIKARVAMVGRGGLRFGEGGEPGAVNWLGGLP